MIPFILTQQDTKQQWLEGIKYTPDLPSPTTLDQELYMWYNTWTSSNTPLSQLSEIYNYCLSSINYPNLSMLIKVLVTIPVTSAATERANSTLKYIKTSLRSTMSQVTLNAFVLGYKHKALLCSIPRSAYTDRFIGLKKRRLYLANPLTE